MTQLTKRDHCDALLAAIHGNLGELMKQHPKDIDPKWLAMCENRMAHIQAEIQNAQALESEEV